MQFLVIEGNIGAGKTTLSKKIAEEYKARLILEQFEDNPFLPKFYNNPEKYSFPLELSFLAERYNQIKKQFAKHTNRNSFLLADYYFSKSSIFARSTLEKEQYNLFQQIFDIIFEKIPKPDLLVYLDASPDKLLRQIATRGRSYEKKINKTYLKKIESGYYDYFNQTNTFPILLIDTNNLDFVNNSNHYDLLKEAIFKSDYKLGVNEVIL